MEETHGIDLLVASIAALAAGPLLYRLAERSRGAVVAVHTLVVLAVVALMALHVLPECVEVAGWVALLAAAVGLAAPAIVEHRVSHAGAHGGSALLCLLALAAHAFTDGMALAGGHAHGHEHGGAHGLDFAVVLHQLPVGAALFWMLRSRGRRVVAAVFAASVLATVAGFVLGDLVLALLDATAFAVFTAFAGGVLLHVIAHRHRGDRHPVAGASPAHREA